MATLVLYTRERCHLCDEMEDDLLLAWREFPRGLAEKLNIERRDVDSQEAWRVTYGLRVPVLCADHADDESEVTEICSGRFDQQAFARWMSQ